jgi:hypothetical protein
MNIKSADKQSVLQRASVDLMIKGNSAPAQGEAAAEPGPTLVSTVLRGYAGGTLGVLPRQTARGLAMALGRAPALTRPSATLSQGERDDHFAACGLMSGNWPLIDSGR